MIGVSHAWPPPFLNALFNAWFWTSAFVKTWHHFLIMAPLIALATYLMGDWRYASLFAMMEIATFVHNVKIKQYDTSHPMASDNVGFIAYFGAMAVAFVATPKGLMLLPETGFRVLIANSGHMFLLGFALWWTSDLVHNLRRGAVKNMLDAHKDRPTSVGWIVVIHIFFPVGLVWFSQVQYELMVSGK